MTAIPTELDDLTVPIDSLRPYHRNARRHDLEVIRDSLRVNGQYRPIVVNRGTHTKRPDEILAGNGTWEAAKAEGWERIAVTYVDVDDDQAARIVLVDNRANDASGYDDRLLAELLGTLDGEFTGTGYTDDDLAKLVADMGDELLAGDPPPEDDDDAERAPDAGTLLELADVSVDPPRHEVEPGDVWELGHHVLVVAKVHEQWDRYVPLLMPDCLLVPYPGPYTALTEKAETTPLVMVHPDAYLAGHVLDKYAAIHGDDAVRRRK